MELLGGIIIGAFLISVFYAIYLSNVKGIAPENDFKEDLAKANQKIGDYENRIINNVTTIHNLEVELDEMKEKFKDLQHQKISADVKMGQKSENLLPFLSSFPYKDDEIRGLFNPIDLIVFREDEVVFVEVKSGQSQLSEKQRQIRDNIKAGRVRFETHRMDEKGVKIK
jgi:predicted Holliday junction resolvase-like endonuclease